MTETLLPPNSTKLERAIESALADRIDGIDLPIDRLWRAESCPAYLLPWLAWAMSVDVWDDAWSEATKRKVVAASFDVHRRKGTVGAVRRSLEALGIEIAVSEWFEYDGAPHTFRLDASGESLIANGLPVSAKLAEIVSLQIDHVKPARAHYTLRVGEQMTSAQTVRSAFAGKIVDRLTHDFEIREPA